MDQPQTLPTATSSYTSRPFKIYSEDDYYEEESRQHYHLRCDQMLQGHPSPLPFNYPRFTQYLKIKSDIEQANRLVEICNGFKNSSGSLQHFTDEKMKQELFSIYGEIDENSERFHLLFENYKVQRLEQVQEWIEMESRIFSDNDNDNNIHRLEYVDKEPLNEEKELLKYFAKEEISLFTSLSSKCDSGKNVPFVLPRKQNSQTDSKSQKFGKRKQRHEKSSNYRDTELELLVKESVQILHKHPLGMTGELFIQKCNESLNKKGYYNSTINLNLDTLQQSPLKDSIYIQNYNDSVLIFPHELKSELIPNPSSNILWNLRHRMLTILNLSFGIIEVKECVQLLNQIFQIKGFHFQNWGFQTELDFVKCVFEKWKSNNVEVVELAISKEAKHFLAVITKKNNKLICDKILRNPIKVSQEDNKSNVSTKDGKKCLKQLSKDQNAESTKYLSTSQNQDISPVLPTYASTSVWSKPFQPPRAPLLNYDPSATTAISSKFVQVGETLFRAHNEIKVGSQIGCVVALVKSPTTFHLVQQVKWKQLNRLFCEMGDYWTSNSTLIERPHPKFLQKNFICMAKTDNEDEVEVYRVVILGKAGPDNYRVYCVDYGDLLVVRPGQLRYLPRQFLHILEAQSITCSLYNVASPTKDPKTGMDLWNKDVCDFTRKLFIPKGNDTPLVNVLFKQMVSGNHKWLVKVSSPKVSDFGEEIMKFVNKRK